MNKYVKVLSVTRRNTLRQHGQAKEKELQWRIVMQSRTLPKKVLARVVRKLDSAIHRINHCPAVKYYDNQLRYPVDSAIHLSNNRGQEKSRAQKIRKKFQKQNQMT